MKPISRRPDNLAVSPEARPQNAQPVPSFRAHLLQSSSSFALGSGSVHALFPESRTAAPPSAFASHLPFHALVNYAVPDPGVLKEGKLYTMVGTTNETADTFHMYQSQFRNGPWRRVKDAMGKPVSIFDAKSRPAWISKKEPDRWAPELHKIDNQYVCIYTARAEADGMLKVAMAVADDVKGPYRDLGPIISAPHGVIDATIKRDRLSKQWVIAYKDDDNSVGLPTPISTRTFTLKDGEFAWTGKPNVIALSGKGQGGLIEGPSFCDANGATWCVVSSGYFGGDDYKMWIGRIDDIVNGKLTDERQLLTTDSPCLRGKWVGPGHCSLVQEAPGIFSIFFHAWPAKRDLAPSFGERFKAGGEGRKPLRATLAFIDEKGQPCEPYIVEDRIKAHPRVA